MLTSRDNASCNDENITTALLAMSNRAAGDTSRHSAAVLGARLHRHHRGTYWPPKSEGENVEWTP